MKNQQGNKRADDRAEKLWQELAEVREEAVLTREQFDETAEALERYTVDMPTLADSDRLLQRLMAADCGNALEGHGTEELAAVQEPSFVGMSGFQDPIAPGSWSHLVRISRLVRCQTRLFAWPFWLVSAFLVGMGGWFGFYSDGGAVEPMAVIVPVLAALSVCAAFRTFGTPMFELEMTMPITPAQLVYGRLCLIVGYDLIIALAVSPLAASGSRTLGALIASWLLPLAVTSLTALAAVLYVRPYAAAAISLSVWSFMLLLNGRHTVMLRSFVVGPGLTKEVAALLYAAVLIACVVLIHVKVRRLRSQGV